MKLTESNTNHNHTVTEKAYRMNFHQRRLPEEVKKEAANLLHMQINKKLLKDKLQKDTGKIILLKDLSNIASEFKGSPNSLDETVKRLQDVYGCDVKVLKNNDVLHGVFFQDGKMADAYLYYPEILFLDGTYKLLDIRFTCYIFLIEDGNGNTFVLLFDSLQILYFI